MLKQRVIDVNVESLGLKGGKAIGNCGYFLTHSIEMVERFRQAEVFEIVTEHF